MWLTFIKGYFEPTFPSKDSDQPAVRLRFALSLLISSCDLYKK